MVHRLIVAYRGTAYSGWQRQENAVTVQQVLERQGRLTASQVEALGVGVAAALTAIHAAGLVHRFGDGADFALGRGQFVFAC